MSIKCPHCQQKLSEGESLPGQRVKCSSCGKKFHLPMAVETPEEMEIDRLPDHSQTFEVVKASPPPTPIEVTPTPQSGRDCPFCGERVMAVAKKCKHCGETLDVALRSAEEARRFSEQAPPGGGGGGGGAASASTTVVVRDGRGFPHGLHLLLTLCTCGLWLPIWIVLALFSSR